MSEPLSIDVRRIIESKNPTLLKRLPGFLLDWVERFIHQEEMNVILKKGHNQIGVPFIQTVFSETNIQTNSLFLERIPEKGGCIIAANHPLGGVDGMALMLEVSKRRSDFLFLANDILLNIAPLKSLFLPVNRVGSTDRKSLALISEAYASGKVIIIFPSGFVSRKINGIIQDLPWQKSVIQKAKQHDLPIIPAFIGGANSKRFYRIAQWRKRLGIKANFEMFTLPDEMFRQKGNIITMTFGNPVLPEQLKSHKPLDSAEKLRQLVYQLERNPDAIFS